MKFVLLLAALLTVSAYEINVQEVVTSVYSKLGHLQSFHPDQLVLQSKEFQLQAQTPCDVALSTLYNDLTNDTECMGVLNIMTNFGSASTTPLQMAQWLDHHCHTSNCSIKWRQHYDIFYQACQGVPHPSTVHPLNEDIYRTLLVIFTMPCINVSSAVTYSGQTFVVTHCWVHLHRISLLNMSNATQGVLASYCSSCVGIMYTAVRSVGPNELIIGARLAVNFCLQRTPSYDLTASRVYCTLQMQSLMAAQAANPNAFVPSAANWNDATMDQLCQPCVRAFARENLLLENIFHAINSTHFNVTVQQQLMNLTQGLALGCAKDVRDGGYCLKKVLSLGSVSDIITMLTPCLNALGTGTCPSDCKQVVQNLYSQLGCCFGTFIRSAMVAQPGVAAQAALILIPCGYWPLPTACSNTIINVQVPFPQLKYAIAQADAKKGLTTFTNAILFALQADAMDLRANISCWPAADGSTICGGTLFPDLDAQALERVASWTFDYTQNVTALPQIDVLPLDNRTQCDASPYNAASIQVNTTPSCMNFPPPVAYHWDASSMQCVQNQQSSASSLSMNALVLFVVASLFMFLW